MKIPNAAVKAHTAKQRKTSIEIEIQKRKDTANHCRERRGGHGKVGILRKESGAAIRLEAGIIF